jgi:hypothetical protein
MSKLRKLVEAGKRVTEDCNSQEWSLFGTGCLYAGNYCLVRKGDYIDHTRIWEQHAAGFVVKAGNTIPLLEAILKELEGVDVGALKKAIGYKASYGTTTTYPYQTEDEKSIMQLIQAAQALQRIKEICDE